MWIASVLNWANQSHDFREWHDLYENSKDDSDSCDSDTSESENERGSIDSVRRGFVQVICDDVILDDDNAVVVLVFPRAKGFGGDGQSVRLSDVVENPIDEARKMFTWKGAMETGLGTLHQVGASTTQQCYQEAVRSKIVDTVVGIGLRVDSFESIDEDETYLKVGFHQSKEENVLCNLAKCFRYKLPLSSEAYRHMHRSFAGHPPGKPPKNREGDESFGYHEWNERIQHKLAPFRDVDMIRLVMQALDEHMSFSEMQRQRVISRYFPAAKHEKVLELQMKWVMPTKFTFWRESRDDDIIRDYFGEEIAFFFQYYAFYIRMLFYLACCALVMVCVETRVLNLGFVMHSYWKLGFGVFISLWATTIQVVFEKKTARSRQRWGMEWATKSADRTLPDYKADIEGTWCLVFQQTLSYGLVVCACVIYSVIWGMASFRLHGPQEALATSILIRLSSFCWSYIVPALSRLHNHRTLRRKNKSMTVQLAVFKLFVYLTPFLRTAFVTNWTQKTCASSLHEAAGIAFNSTGWPTGVENPTTLEWLQPFVVPASLLPEDRVCLGGCKPIMCRTDFAGHVRCKTKCFYTLGESLDLIYITHTGCSVVFLMIAIAYARFKVKLEMSSAVAEHKEYSYLQFQAKCHEVTPYEYLSWGGSYVEDFLEVVLGFALLCCFGMLRPRVVLVVFLLQVVEYRLLAYRMTHVTARPYPTGSQGIDMWMRIISCICIMAVLVNSALAVFMLPAFTNWEQNSKLIMFLSYSLIILGIRCFVQSVSRKRPTDVSRIEDYNFEVMTQVSRNEGHLNSMPTLAHDELDIDIGLAPPRK